MSEERVFRVLVHGTAALEELKKEASRLGLAFSVEEVSASELELVGKLRDVFDELLQGDGDVGAKHVGRVLQGDERGGGELRGDGAARAPTLAAAVDECNGTLNRVDDDEDGGAAR